MRFLTNHPDPKVPRARHVEIEIDCLFGSLQARTVPVSDAWLSGKIIGEPQATAHRTVEQLKADGIVGVYAPE